MIESTALFFSLFYLYYGLSYIEDKNALNLILACLGGLLAAVIKVTTFVPFFLFPLTVIAWNLYKNKSFELTGKEALSYGRAAEILSKELGRKISHIDVSEEEARKGMKKLGMSDWLIDDIMKFYGIIRLGYASQITNTIEEITGKRPILFSQFAKDYAKALE